MLQPLPSIAHTELVQMISDCYDNFRDTIEKVVETEAVLFFPSLVHEESVYIQPLIIPTQIAKDMMTALLERDRLDMDRFTDYLHLAYQSMKMNAVSPCPVRLHIHLLEIFEMIVINGMPDKPHLVQKLLDLKVGDLIVIQVELSNTAVHTGLEVIPHALGVYNSMMSMMKSSTTVH
jgi:hypothetical protein